MFVHNLTSLFLFLFCEVKTWEAVTTFGMSVSFTFLLPMRRRKCEWVTKFFWLNFIWRRWTSLTLFFSVCLSVFISVSLSLYSISHFLSVWASHGVKDSILCLLNVGCLMCLFILLFPPKTHFSTYVAFISTLFRPFTAFMYKPNFLIWNSVCPTFSYTFSSVFSFK